MIMEGCQGKPQIMEHDLFSILLVALAVYAFLSIAWQVFLIVIRFRRLKAERPGFIIA